MKASRPYCCKCFEKIHVEYCASCGTSIGVEQGQITYEDQHWHATDECFKCFTCAKSLRGGLMFIPKHGVIYCSNVCLKQQKNSGNTAISVNNGVKSAILGGNTGQQAVMSPYASPSVNKARTMNAANGLLSCSVNNPNASIMTNQMGSPGTLLSLNFRATFSNKNIS